MFNLENLWGNLLNKEEINYNGVINTPVGKRKEYNKVEKFNLSKLCFKITIFLIIGAILIWIYKTNNEIKNIEYINDLSNIQEPTQIKTLGNINKTIDDFNVEINYVATYSISGRVVDVQNYYGYHIRDKLSPKDVGITWGFLANEKNHKKVKWSSTGNRYLSWYSNDSMWLNEIGGINKITKYYSNNHLIPSDSKTEKLIKSIKEGDYIRIEGYLVNIYCKQSSGNYFIWNTSTSRTDSGNGACEIIYVTNITWLEKE